jgi:hypothetical protein
MRMDTGCTIPCGDDLNESRLSDSEFIDQVSDCGIEQYRTDLTAYVLVENKVW